MWLLVGLALSPNNVAAVNSNSSEFQSLHDLKDKCPQRKAECNVLCKGVIKEFDCDYSPKTGSSYSCKCGMSKPTTKSAKYQDECPKRKASCHKLCDGIIKDYNCKFSPDSGTAYKCECGVKESSSESAAKYQDECPKRKASCNKLCDGIIKDYNCKFSPDSGTAYKCECGVKESSSESADESSLRKRLEIEEAEMRKIMEELKKKLSSSEELTDIEEQLAESRKRIREAMLKESLQEARKESSSSKELTDIEEKLAESRKRMEELKKKLSSKTSSRRRKKTSSSSKISSRRRKKTSSSSKISSSRSVKVVITSRRVLKSLVESLDSSGRLTRDQEVAGFILRKGDKLRSSSKSLVQGVTKVAISASKHITLVFDVLKIPSVSGRRRRQASTNFCEKRELHCKAKCSNNASRVFACSYSSVTGTKYSCSCSSSSSSSKTSSSEKETSSSETSSSKKVVEEYIKSSSVVKALKSLEAKVQGCCGKVATSARRRRRRSNPTGGNKTIGGTTSKSKTTGGTTSKSKTTSKSSSSRSSSSSSSRRSSRRSSRSSSRNSTSFRRRISRRRVL